MKILLATSLLLNLVLGLFLVFNSPLIIKENEIALRLKKSQATSLRRQEMGLDSQGEARSQPAPSLDEFVGAPQVLVSMPKAELNRHLENLPKVLQDARAVPYVIPNSGGQIHGFKLVSIKPNSVYAKLGLQRGDIIQGVNGKRIDSPQKAMELYQNLKQGVDLELQVIQGDQPKNLRYDFKKSK